MGQVLGGHRLHVAHLALLALSLLLENHRDDVGSRGGQAEILRVATGRGLAHAETALRAVGQSDISVHRGEVERFAAGQERIHRQTGATGLLVNPRLDRPAAGVGQGVAHHLRPEPVVVRP